MSTDHAIDRDPGLVPAFDTNPGPGFDADSSNDLSSSSVQNIYNVKKIVAKLGKKVTGAAYRADNERASVQPPTFDLMLPADSIFKYTDFLNRRQRSERGTGQQAITASHGHPQPQKSHKCLANFLGKNETCDGKTSGPTELLGRNWISDREGMTGPPELSLTGQNSTAEVATSRCRHRHHSDKLHKCTYRCNAQRKPARYVFRSHAVSGRARASTKASNGFTIHKAQAHAARGPLPAAGTRIMIAHDTRVWTKCEERSSGVIGYQR
ncbi:hypothetical protein EVAR_85021_1 [Eumeta japonica]|uniref:Uncharacterized protein n=1 Tax=Eumeta variegata TaxID=151549 RepID=A0A4C1WA85_EUMVA|nr:hypothetical protein EVAR_85021_1 [Eumeta japonica]